MATRNSSIQASPSRVFNVASCTLFILLFLCFSCQQKINSHGLEKTIHDHWAFHADTANAKSFPATVPGTVHTDLMAAELISDPFYGNNEKSAQHLETIPWVYETTFTVSDDELVYENIQLIFDGIDTYAEVLLNDSSLGICHNMFRSWDFDCKPILRAGTNELKLVFRSPQAFNKEKAQTLGYALPADNETGDLKISPFTRKAPYHFGWDWGPRIVTSVIWKPVR